jgi:hypothetical protein
MRVNVSEGGEVSYYSLGSRLGLTNLTLSLGLK